MILQQLEAHFIRLVKNSIHCNTTDTLHIQKRNRKMLSNEGGSL